MGKFVQMISTARKGYCLERASRAGIPSVVIHKSDYETMEALNEARHQALCAAKPDLIVLAGFLGILPPQTIQAFSGKIINIHPALIPSFCGKGMFGHHVHEAVLAYGAKLSGATVHFVNEEVDGGPVILQRSVEVLEDDTPDSLGGPGAYGGACALAPGGQPVLRGSPENRGPKGSNTEKIVFEAQRRAVPCGAPFKGSAPRQPPENAFIAYDEDERPWARAAYPPSISRCSIRNSLTAFISGPRARFRRWIPCWARPRRARLC